MWGERCRGGRLRWLVPVVVLILLTCASLHVLVDRLYRRPSFSALLYAKLPTASDRVAVLRHFKSGWGDFMRGVLVSLYGSKLSNRQLVIVWQMEDHDVLQYVFVPRLISWNVSSIPNDFLPKSDSSCQVLTPSSSPRNIRPIIKFFRLIDWLEKYPQSGKGSFRANFKGANALSIPRRQGDLKIVFDLMNSPQFDVVALQIAWGGNFIRYRRTYPEIFKSLAAPSEYEALFQLSVPMAAHFDRVIARTFFMYDPLDNSFRPNVTDVGEWQQQMADYMGRGDVESKRRIARQVTEGISQTMPLGSMIHCKRQSLMENVVDRLGQFGGNLTNEFLALLDFRLAVAHFRMGDRHTNGTTRKDERLFMDDVGPCLKQIDSLPTQKLIFLSDSPAARRMALEKQPKTVIVPLGLSIDYFNLHDFHAESPEFYLGLVSEWLFIASADALALTHSGFCASAAVVNANVPTVTCKHRKV